VWRYEVILLTHNHVFIQRLRIGLIIHARQLRIQCLRVVVGFSYRIIICFCFCFCFCIIHWVFGFGAILPLFKRIIKNHQEVVVDVFECTLKFKHDDVIGIGHVVFVVQGVADSAGVLFTVPSVSSITDSTYEFFQTSCRFGRRHFKVSIIIVILNVVIFVFLYFRFIFVTFYL